MTMVLLTACCLLAPGCVKRTIVIESDPPGAKVWINERPAGVTPITLEFITHGRYKFRLEKTGFQEVAAREMVRAPIYQWIGLDFVAEYLLPIPLEDRHHFRYTLVPKGPTAQELPKVSDEAQAAVGQLHDAHPEKRRLACVTLARLREPSTAGAALSAAQDPVPAVRVAALGAVRALQGPQAMGLLLEALARDPSAEVRWKAAAELEALGVPQAVPGLIAALKDSDPLVRAGAAEALKGIPDPRAVGPLVRALRERHSAIRRAAAEGLGRIGEASAVRPLTRALFHHDVHTRRKAAKSLSQLRSPEAGPAFVRAFTDWDPKVRQIATQALIQMQDTRVVPQIIRRLRSWKPETREHAAIALGGLKDPRAAAPLRRAVAREPNETTHAAMTAALQQLGAVE